MKISNLFFLLILSLSAISQNEQKLDSLKSLLLKTDNNITYRNEINLSISQTYLESKDSINVYKYLNKVQAPEGKNLIRYLRIKAYINQFSYKYKTSLIFFKEYLIESLKQNDFCSQIDAYSQIVLLHYYEQDIDSSKLSFHSCQNSIMKQIDFNRENKTCQSYILNLYGNYAIALARNNEFDSAMHYFKAVLEGRYIVGDDDKTILAINNLGLLFNIQGIPDSSIHYYLKAQEIIESNNIKNSIVYSNLAGLYINIKDFHKAIAYGKRAINIDDDDYGKGYSPIGVSYLNLSEFDSSEIYLKKALEFNIQSNNRRSIINTKLNLISLYLKWPKIDSASKYLSEQKLLDYLSSKMYSQANANVLFYKGKLHYLKSEFNSCILSLDSSLAISDSLKMYNNINRSLYYKAMSYYNQEMYKDGILVFKNFVNSKIKYDSLYNLKTISGLEAQYQTKQKEQQIALQNEQLKTQEAEIKSRNIMLGAGSSVILMLLAIGVIYQKRRKTEDKIKNLNEKHNAVEQLRDKISKELHDGIGYKMREIRTQLENTELPDKENILNKVKATTNDIKRLSYRLKPTDIENISLREAIEIHVASLNHISSIFFDLKIFPENLLDKLSKPAQHNLHRIVQECTSNVIDHSKAQKVEINIAKIDKQINLMFEDDGVGFEKELIKEGSGLINIKKRCDDMNAKLHIDSKVGRGTIISIYFDKDV